jgi:acyl-homoserine-lactone acylase
MMINRLAMAAGLMVGALALTGCPKQLPPLESLKTPEGTYDVTIHRDDYGVPHIYGPRDADVAYGLAYAQCEDDFKTVQEVMLLSQGKLATHLRWDGLKFDFIGALFRARKWVEEGYDTELSPEVRAVCEAYAAGINQYAALHPDEVYAPQGFPATGKDIVAGFVVKVPFFYGLDKHLKTLLGVSRGKPKKEEHAAAEEPMENLLWSRLPKGSNSFAIAPSRAADGYTRLDINSHQPWEGPVSWYEVRLHSDEGWNMMGGVFPGTPVVLHGHNADLGWAHTVNEPDLCDIYKLTINPDNANQYWFDGAWKDFEREMIPLEIRLWGNIFIKVPREFIWSVHGPAMRTGDGVFAVSFAGFGDIKLVEQIFRMNKATDLASFQEAMKLRAMPSMNTMYADKTGNIWYVFNAALPERAEGYDWTGTLPGDTSDTLWKGVIPFERLPQVLNPKSGWLQSCNNDPFYCTAPEDAPKRADYADRYGIDTIMRNRAWRLIELLGADDSITREEFLAYKFDMKFSTQSMPARLVKEVLAHPATGDATLDAALEVLRGWDLSCDDENLGAAIGVGTVLPTIAAELFGEPIPDTWDNFTTAAELLTKSFGRVDVPWKQVNLMHRGDKRIGLGGGPDILYAVYGRPQEDGTLKGEAGDSYILIPEWDPQGKLTSHSLHQFGSATMDAKSPHYADQTVLFQKRELKPVWFEEAELQEHTQISYQPGAFTEPWYTQVQGE